MFASNYLLIMGFFFAAFLVLFRSHFTNIGWFLFVLLANPGTIAHFIFNLKPNSAPPPPILKSLYLEKKIPLTFQKILLFPEMD